MDNEDIKNENKTIKLFWISPLVAGVLLVLIFKAAHRFPGDEHVFLVGDYYVQFVEYIVMFWRKMLSGNGLLYSFDLGLGAATWEHYSFYGLSPFNIVFIFIKDANTAAFVLYLLKVCAIALSMHLFLSKGMRVKESIAVLFAVPYALSTYVIGFYFCIILIDYLYILPIVMLMMIRLFRTGRSIGLIAIYAFSFLTAYYGGYMIGIFSFVCFIVMLLFGKYQISKNRIVIQYAFGVVIAVLISAVVTVPTAEAILIGRFGESEGGLKLGLNVLDIISAMYPIRKIDEYTMQPAIYCGLVTVISSISYFVDKRYEKKEKIIAALPVLFLVICTLAKPAYLLMHGFDEPDGYYFRFAFMFSFYFSAIGARWMEKRKEDIGLMPFLVVILADIVIMLKGCLITESDLDDPGIIATLITCFFVLLHYLTLRNVNKRRRILICAVAFSELFLNAYYNLTPDSVAIERWKDSYDLWNRHGELAMSKIAGMEEADGERQFYRVNFRKGLWTNDGMYFGYHGLSYFSSMEQRNTRQLLYNLGYSTGKRIVAEKGGSPFTEMIFSQKYRVITEPNILNENCERVDVEKNNCVLPLAFMVSDDVMNIKMTNDPFENQQSLLNAMLGHEELIWNEYTGDVDVDSYNASHTEYGGMQYISRNGEGSGRVSLSIKTDADKEDYYAYISREYSAFYYDSPITFSDIEGDSVCLFMPSYLYMPAMIKLGNNDGQHRINILLKEDSIDPTNFTKCFFAQFDHNGLSKAYEELEKGGLDISRMKDYDIVGNIVVTDDKNIMFTSIPYDKNWHISADGIEVDTFSTLNGAFLACYLPEGEHNIRIYYEDNAILIGAIISTLGILIMIIFREWSNKASKYVKQENTVQ